MTPLYEYKCCGQTWSTVNKVSHRDCEICLDCGKHAKRILPRIARPVVMNYYSESLDAKITGPKQKEKVMREKNVTEVGNAFKR